MVAVKAVDIGDVISWDGDSWEVLTFNGLSAQLRSRTTRGYVLTAWAEVIGSPDFDVLRAGRPGDGFGQVAGNPLDGYSAKAQARAHDREAAILVMRTGYGTWNPQSDERRDDSYDGLGEEGRQALLGKRIGVGSRQVRRLLSAYDDFGIVGLVDMRGEGLMGGPGRIDPALRAAMNEVLDELPFRSKMGNAEKRRRVAAKLNLLEKPPPLPAQRTFDRYLNKIGEFRGLHLSQKSQREAANRPVDSVPWATVNRPMQWVLLDTTPLDMFALDPMADDRETKWLRVWLSVGIDAFTRSIVGWVFTSKEPAAEDIALLLYRISTPKTVAPDWPSHGQWRYPGVPTNLIFAAPHEEHVHENVAGVPFGHVETFIVDHGKQYISTAVREAARILKSNLQLARVWTPTDKSLVERGFLRIREQFVQRLPGYKGPNLFERGDWKTIEGEAFMFLWEIDQAFAEWVACDYQNTPHKGLRFQDCPDLDLSPNQAYDFGITRSGGVPVPPPQDLRIELLPTEWRRVNHYGIEINGVRYNDDVLNPFRNQRSPWTSKGGKWKVKVDRYDRSCIWFWAIDPNTLDATEGSWEPLRYRGWNVCPLFGDEEIAYAKAIILGSGGRIRRPFDLEPTLDRVLARLDEQRDLPTSERRMLGRTFLRALGSKAGEEREPSHFGGTSGGPLPGTSQFHQDRSSSSTEASGVVEADELDDVAFTTLDGPDVVELDYFADTDPGVDPESLSGMESLADEPQDPG